MPLDEVGGGPLTRSGSARVEQLLRGVEHRGERARAAEVGVHPADQPAVGGADLLDAGARARGRGRGRPRPRSSADPAGGGASPSRGVPRAGRARRGAATGCPRRPRPRTRRRAPAGPRRDSSRQPGAARSGRSGTSPSIAPVSWSRVMRRPRGLDLGAAAGARDAAPARCARGRGRSRRAAPRAAKSARAPRARRRRRAPPPPAPCAAAARVEDAPPRPMPSEHERAPRAARSWPEVGEEPARRAGAGRLERGAAAGGIGADRGEQRAGARPRRGRRTAGRRRRSAGRSRGRRAPAAGSRPSWNMKARVLRSAELARLVRRAGRRSPPSRRRRRPAPRPAPAAAARDGMVEHPADLGEAAVAGDAGHQPLQPGGVGDPARGAGLAVAAVVDELHLEPAGARPRRRTSPPAAGRRGPRSAGGSWWRRARRSAGRGRPRPAARGRRASARNAATSPRAAGRAGWPAASAR